MKPFVKGSMSTLIAFWRKTKMPLTTRECSEMVGVSEQNFGSTLRRYHRRGALTRTSDIFIRNGEPRLCALWMLNEAALKPYAIQPLLDYWNNDNKWLTTRQCAEVLGMELMAAYGDLMRHLRAGLIVRMYRNNSVGAAGYRRVAIWKKA